MPEANARHVTFRSDALTLEGVLHIPGESAAGPAAAAVVCHPHPQHGGDMDNNVVLAACRGLTDRGYAALRFNVRGAGGSEGAYEDGPAYAGDVRAALAYLVSLDGVDATRVGLIGYSAGAMAAAEAASGDLRALALIAPPVAYGDLRVAWGCPALLLAGELDTFAPAERLAIVAGAQDVDLTIVPGADHFWVGREDAVSDAIGNYFERRFTA